MSLGQGDGVGGKVGESEYRYLELYRLEQVGQGELRDYPGEPVTLLCLLLVLGFDLLARVQFFGEEIRTGGGGGTVGQVVRDEESGEEKREHCGDSWWAAEV